MALTIWTSCGCDCSKPSTDERKPWLESSRNCGFGVGARGFVRGKSGESGDAVGLFAVGFGELADFGLQRAEQLQQFRACARR